MANEKIILRAFGLQFLKPLVYNKTLGKSLPQNSSEYENLEAQVNTRMNTGADDQEVTSSLGTPIFADITLESGDLSLNIPTVLLEVSQQKNIVTTTVQGRSGTVKEYISDGDYSVTMRGLIVSTDAYTYPTEDVSEFIDIMKVQSDIEVVSPFLQLFEIYNIVVTDYRLIQIEGFQNQQAFEISAISDVPLELIDEEA